MGAVAIVGAGLRIWSKNWFLWFLVTLAMTGVVLVIIAASTHGRGRYGFQSGSENDPSPVPTPPHSPSS